MLTLEAARSLVVQAFSPTQPVDVMLIEARGLVLAEDVMAEEALPRFDNSAMDGYALRSLDVSGATAASPASLRVAGEAKAGSAPVAGASPGSAVRIMTGGPLPSGADSVVPVEETQEAGGFVSVRSTTTPGTFIRKAGEDLPRGALAIRAGVELASGELALLAALGRSSVSVRKRPRVSLITTGDELVDVTADLGPGQIRDSNSVALTSLVEEAGGEVVSLQRARDSWDETVQTFRSAADGADIVVSAGGVAVGRYDLVKRAVEELGHIDFWKVAMQPGKPVVLGSVLDTPFLGLPGNPVSVHISFEQFVRPALRRLRGCARLFRPRLDAVITQVVRKPKGRLHLLRVRLQKQGDGWLATPIGAQGSHIMSSLVDCHGVAVFDAHLEELGEGARVSVEVWQLPSES